MRINNEIFAPRLRLVDEEGGFIGLVSRQEALQKAQESGLDLVEINPAADPPVCKIMSYHKFIYKRNKQLSEAKKKQKRMDTKQLQIRPGIGEGDYQVKLRNLIRFLEDNNKVEVSVKFRFRELSHRELGLAILKRIQADLIDKADTEREPLLKDRQMMMVLVPKKL